MKSPKIRETFTAVKLGFSFVSIKTPRNFKMLGSTMHFGCIEKISLSSIEFIKTIASSTVPFYKKIYTVQPPVSDHPWLSPRWSLMGGGGLWEYLTIGGPIRSHGVQV